MNVARMLIVIAAAATTSQLSTAQEPSKSDPLKIAVQGICPVSGQQLAAHGRPIKAKIGQEQIFLCCKGCLQGKVNPQHWATIHANFAKAQGKCPVMDKPLPKNPKWTIVEGQIVYICCPPCTKKIEAEPATYLGIVDELYTASLRNRRAVR
jgi:hypothetical protein